jgi:hypothetical protein
MDIDDLIENPEKVETKDIPNGIFTWHPEKLICYLDIMGVTEFYKYLSEKEIIEIKKLVTSKLFDGFIYLFKSIDADVYSVHILSDTAIIVPKSEPRASKKLPTYNQFISLIMKYYEKLITNGNHCKFLVSRGMYFSVFDKNRKFNILPGGKVISDCANAEKLNLKNKGPGIFSNLPYLNKSLSCKWDFIDFEKFNCKFENIENIIKSLNNLQKNLKKKKNSDVKYMIDNLKKWVKAE